MPDHRIDSGVDMPFVVILILVVLIVWLIFRSRVRPATPSSSSYYPRRKRQRRSLLPELPAIKNEIELAEALGISIKELRWLQELHNPFSTDGLSVHYQRVEIAKKQGGTRLLLVPRLRLRQAQRWILRHILDKVPAHLAAHGFYRGRSIVTNAKPHAGHEVVLCIDLRDFFPTLHYPRVRGLFRSFGYHPDVACILALLCTTRLPGTWRRVLPQGAPSSPALANLIAYHLDIRLAGLAKKFAFQYTRYADDCTFSGDVSGLNTMIRSVRKIIRDEGFKVHEGKLRIHRTGKRQLVTGLVVNESPSVTRTERRRLRALLHNAQKSSLAEQNHDNHANFTDYLLGKIAFIQMINPQHALPLRKLLGQLIPALAPVVEEQVASLSIADVAEKAGLDNYSEGAEKLPE